MRRLREGLATGLRWLARRLRVLAAAVDPWEITCDYCGSARIEWSAWLDARTGNNTGGEPPVENAYCVGCLDAEAAVTERPKGHPVTLAARQRYAAGHGGEAGA